MQEAVVRKVLSEELKKPTELAEETKKLLAWSLKAQLGYWPLKYFWIAWYNDGTALSQFDPESGEEIGFLEIDLPRVVKFGWYPITPKLARLVRKKGLLVVVDPWAKPLEVQLNSHRSLVAFRRNYLKYGKGKIERWTEYWLGYYEDGKEHMWHVK